MTEYLQRIRDSRAELRSIALNRSAKLSKLFPEGAIPEAKVIEARIDVLNAEIELCEAEIRLKEGQK